MFVPALIFILLSTLIIIKRIVSKQSYKINYYTLYIIVLFYMFTGIYFITEGQGRYSFPLIFIIIYCFYYFIKGLLIYTKELIL